MQYGDVFELLRDGIRSDPNALQPVGIFGNSQCWAVWLHDASKDKPDPAPHLVISPLHPRFWPFLLKFELKLAERVGAMAEAAEFLAGKGLNIHFGESSPSGHHHATWNVVCEAVNVRRAFEDQIQAFRREKQPLKDREELNQLANRLAEAMYQTAADARAQMESCTFLHERIRKPPMFLLHRPEHLALQEAAKQLAIDDFPAAVRVKWIQNLPVFAFYGSKIGEPHRLEFDPETSMLRTAGGGEPFVEVLKEGGIETLPTNAIVSIYPEEHHVRVIPIRSAKEMDGLLQIDVRYEAHFESAVAPNAPADHDTSINLWARVCHHIQAYNIDLRRVTNTTTRRASDNEAGVLSLVGVREGELSEKQMQQLTMRIEGLQESPAPGEKGRQLVLFPTLSPRAIRKVFISWRMEVSYGPKLREQAEESARKWGLDPVFVDIQGESLIDSVTSNLAQCDAFFQILSMTGPEITAYLKDSSQSPALGWMLFEFGLAKGRGIPFIRVVDTTTAKISDWNKILRVGGDLLGEFQLGHEAKQVDDLMRRLAYKVRERTGTQR